MVGITGLVEICGMAAGTSSGRIGIIAVVTGRTVIGNNSMPARQRVEIVVVKSRRRPGSFRVAARTVCRKLSRFMIRIRRLVEIC